MNPVDIVCLAVLLVSAVFGLVRGFAREILGLASWIGAAYGAVLLYPSLSVLARRVIENVPVAEIAGGLVGFVLLLIVFSVVADLIARAIRRTLVGGIDRALGVAFGLARGIVIVIAAYVAGSLVLPPSHWPAPVRQARAAPLAFAGASWAVAFIPPGDRPAISPPEPVSDVPTTQPARTQAAP